MFQIRWSRSDIWMKPRTERVVEPAAQSLRGQFLWECKQQQDPEEARTLPVSRFMTHLLLSGLPLAQ